jgi:iron(III) transport system substrate-binding protein
MLLTGCAAEPADEVVIYVAVDRAQAEPILKQFEAESGIAVRAMYDAEAAKTTGLVTRLLAEADRPRCDVFWNNELVQTLLLAERGVLEPYRSPAAEDIPTQFKDPDGQWTGIATRARVIVYNTRLVKPSEAPTTLAELADPRWRGKVAMANPQFGTTRMHVACLFALLGPDEAQRMLMDLKNNEVRIVDGNAMVKNLVARAHPDASPILVGLTDTDDVAAGQRDGEPVAACQLNRDQHGGLLIPSTVCLVRGAPHAAAARRLVDYLVSRTVERRLAEGDSGFRGVRDAASSVADNDRGQIAPQRLLEQLEPSTRWTREHFQP